jgi:ABC-type thiamine transport system ATPase subunit
MPLVDTVVDCAISDSFRVQQVAGMFDVPLPEKLRASQRFSVEVPGLDEPWQIGAIVGPSGSGKTTIARHVFADAVYQAGEWPAGKAVVDGFGDLPIKTITHVLTAVGFSSPPAWVRPYGTLSNGERFRCDLARALLSGRDLVVFDEFTSVVDRTVARIGSAAVAKAIRSGRLAKRFVAVTCHYDILDWLAPDWVVDMATCQLARGRLQRPQIALEVFRCRCAAWRLFAKHHYLSGELNPAAQCYLACWAGEPVCLVAVIPSMGHQGCRCISRVVTLPDYQGVGIGGKVLDAVADLESQSHKRIGITTSHPAMIRHLARSPCWRAVAFHPVGACRNQAPAFARRSGSAGRAVAGFRYVKEGPALGKAQDRSV